VDVCWSRHTSRRDAGRGIGKAGASWPTALGRPPEGEQDGRAVLPRAGAGSDPERVPPGTGWPCRDQGHLWQRVWRGVARASSWRVLVLPHQVQGSRLECLRRLACVLLLCSSIHLLKLTAALEWNAFIYVVKNSVQAGPFGAATDQFNTLVLSRDSKETGISITATKADTEVILCAGEPLDQPVIQFGPFVMTSNLEIRQTIMDCKCSSIP
jgi:hypothetical protein